MSWYQFRTYAGPESQADTVDTADIQINDFIGDWIDDYFGFGVTAKTFVDELAALPKSVKKIRVSINSPGGDVFGAVNIANALRAQREVGRSVEVTVNGLAASAATIVMMAGDPLRIADNSIVMVHNPWTYTQGNADDLRASAETLDRVRDTIVATYQWHASKLTEKELKALMDAETWMSADEAVKAGFADEVVAGLQAAASVDAKRVANLNVPDRFKARLAELSAKPRQKDDGTWAGVVPEPEPEPVKPEPAKPEMITAADALDLCRLAGIDNSEFVSGLLDLTVDAAVEKIAAEQDRLAQETARAEEITGLCEKFGLGDEFSSALIDGGMPAEYARSFIATITAKLDGTEINAGLPPDFEARRSATLRVRDVYAARQAAISKE